MFKFYLFYLFYFKKFIKNQKKTRIPIFPGRIKNGHVQNRIGQKRLENEKMKKSKNGVYDDNALILKKLQNICDCYFFYIFMKNNLELFSR